MVQDNELGLMRLKDQNEALGLAVNLLAKEAPFSDMPMGSAIGTLIDSINNGNYFFAKRAERAVGIAFWMFTQPEDAERWLFRGDPLSVDAIKNGGPVAIILGVQASETAATRLLFQGLRDTLPADIWYFMRDYGNDGTREKRSVRLIRPRVRRKPKAAAQVFG